MEKRFIIGIDLGTTNSSVAYIDLEKGYKINKFKIEQLIGPGKFATLSSLPSFIYIPGKYDISNKDIRTPWKISQENFESKNFSGAFARDYGSKVPSRLISSTKSWLCNKNIDRKARVLPWGANEDISKISPIQASAFFLKHIKMAWNVLQTNDSFYLENQTVVITVPASFDEIARELTLEAAEIAGLSNVLLLEEPLAVFYSWLSENENNWSKQIKKNQVILVCDVGGGTTDFTLICLKEKNNKLSFERLAVGDHLMLGGDNMDTLIAKKIIKKFNKDDSIGENENWQHIFHQCRKIKEKIFKNPKETSGKITITGSGSNIISNTLTQTIYRDDIEEIIFKKFFPISDKIFKKNNNFGQEFTEQGLPYAKQISITHHLLTFIERNHSEIKEVLNIVDSCPKFFLFNGGSLTSRIIQNRIVSFIKNRLNNTTGKPIILENKDMKSAVSIGAAYYGLVKNGQGIKIGSGSSRAFYIGIQKNTKKSQAICLIERGLEEGSFISLIKKKFELLTNQPVSIDLYSSSFRSGDRCGDIVFIDNTFTTMPPMHTVIKFGTKEKKAKISVTIEAKYTEIGSLELWCKSILTPHKWKLGFQLRNKKVLSNVDECEIFDNEKINLLTDIVRFNFSKNNITPNNIIKEIKKTIKKDKNKWPLSIIRSLTDTSLEYLDSRKISPEFESKLLNFIGFCLRPGIGEGFDSYRVQKVWKLYKHGPIHLNNSQVRLEWWIMWRRVAAGLSTGQQLKFINDVIPILLSKKKNNKSKQEIIEIWMSAANMEKVNIKNKIKLLDHLINKLNSKKIKPQFLWTFSRIGARNLLYASIDRVIPQKEISKWLTKIMSIKWKNPKPVIEMLSRITQKTGDQLRDIEPEMRKKIIEWINLLGDFPEHTEMINKVMKIKSYQQNMIFGESIPTGIVFKTKDF